jgi:GNAT superfamily N-acetyltransferase
MVIDPILIESIIIEPAAVQDAEEILRLQYLAFQSEALIHGDFTIQPLRQTLDELIREFEEGLVLKATANGKIIGSIRAHEAGDADAVHIGKMIVHPDHQSKGLGKRLLSAIEKEFPDKRIELFTSVKSDRNLHIYEVMGYKRFREETDGAGIRFVFLEKTIKLKSNK